MEKIQKILLYQNHIRKLAIIFGLAIIFLFGSLDENINETAENFFRFINGQKEPDSSIVIINIDANDIEKLGGWPLKRSYYALLINKLTNLHVKKIGLEVLLSNNIAFQSIYNNLLNEELLKSGKVVLSSIITNESKNGESFDKDSLIYSQPKIDFPQLPSGHLNYIVRDGIYVPTQIYVNNKTENAFAVQLSGSKYSNLKDLLKINFYTSWKNFKRYSLIEFFRLEEDNSLSLKKFVDKIVLIGVSDPTIAKTLSTYYDEELPGIGFHAIVLDNILTNRALKYQTSTFIAALFLLLLIISSQIKLKISSYKLELIVCAVYFLISFILFNYFYLENNYAVFLVPAFSLFIAEGFISIASNRIKLDEISNEAEMLRKVLSIKEEQLSKLENEYKLNANQKNAANETTKELIEKIQKLKTEINQLKKYHDESEPIDSDSEIKFFEGIVYRSDAMHNITKLISKIAPADATVLILGESGSGKELVAHAIHNLSNRKDKKFVAINCAALPESLLESELFGHVKGAFTNAIVDKKGRFELADGGTIFLDEIAETSENFQAKLLRVIQFGDFEKVGSPQTKHVDVRIIAATNKNLEELVKQKKFREDLYYRLNVLRIEIPPLRKRKEDIEVLANYFLQKEDKSLKMTKAVLESLEKNEWKGNVRELESLIKRMAILAKSEGRTIIKLNDLPAEYYNIDKSDLENFILESLRYKKFSHSSINETAKEMGNLSRTVVSETFRGIFFRIYVQNNFDLDKTVHEIVEANFATVQQVDNEVIERVKSKVETYLENIKKDLLKVGNDDFESIKKRFSSKYKNLPSRYHNYLDEVIKYLMRIK